MMLVLLAPLPKLMAAGDQERISSVSVLMLSLQLSVLFTVESNVRVWVSAPSSKVMVAGLEPEICSGALKTNFPAEASEAS